jgi:hypothetical protein
VEFKISEKKFLQQVIELAKIYHWEYYHTFDSRHSAAGFPDLILIRVEDKGRIVVAECKSEKGKVTVFQDKWIKMFRDCGVEAYIWRPSQWDEIVECLKK